MTAEAGLTTFPIFAEASRFWSPYYACTIFWRNSRFFVELVHKIVLRDTNNSFHVLTTQ